MIRRNIASNVAARAWGFISIYIFVPLYLKFIGIEAYGIVGFYSTLLGVLAFADMGFTATLNREMARLSVRKDSAKEMRDLLRTYETTYLCISSALAVLFWILAPLIVEHWLHAKGLPPRLLISTIRVMGVSIALELPSGLYIGGLMGLQKQVRANSIQIGWGVFRGVGAVLVLWFFSPTIFAFALWQLLSNSIYCFAARLGLWSSLPSSPDNASPRFERSVFRSTWRYAAGMVAITVVSALLTQTDKLAVSKLLSLRMLGYYMIASALAMVPIAFASPIASAVYPRLTGLVASEDSKGLIQFYHRTCELVSMATIPAGLTVSLFAGACIFGWTGSMAIAQQAAPATSLLLGGQIMQAITLVPFYLALAHGNVRLNLLIGIISVVVISPLLIVLIMKYGIVGAGWSWLIMNLFTLPPYMYVLHRRFMPGELRRWALRDVLRPLLASFPIILLARLFLPMPSSRFPALAVVGLVWGTSTAAAALTIPELRSMWNVKLKSRLCSLL